MKGEHTKIKMKLNRKIHRKCVNAHNEWMTKRCREIKQLDMINQQMYDKVG